MERQDIISSGLLELYAAGLTTENETAEIEQWIEQYPEVSTELAEISSSIEAYAQATAVAPAANVKEKIFAQINTTSGASRVIDMTTATTNTPERRGVAPFWRAMAAASVVLLVGSLVFNFITYNKYTSTGNSLAAIQNKFETLQEEKKLLEQDMNVVQSRYSVPVALNGLEASPNAAAKIFWMKNTTGEVFIDPSNLPDAPPGKQYQLWGIVDGKPVNGGMILTSKKGDKYRIQKMKTFGKADAFAVTLEPEKGNPTPQGPMFVMGKM